MRKRSTHTMQAAVALCVVVMATMTTVLAVYVHNGLDDRRQDQIQACIRGNLIRVHVNLLTRAHPGLEIPEIPLVNCQHVY